MAIVKNLAIGNGILTVEDEAQAWERADRLEKIKVETLHAWQFLSPCQNPVFDAMSEDKNLMKAVPVRRRSASRLAAIKSFINR